MTTTKRILSKCFQPTFPDRLPIRVIKHDATLRVEEVRRGDKVVAPGNRAGRPRRSDGLQLW